MANTRVVIRTNFLKPKKQQQDVKICLMSVHLVHFDAILFHWVHFDAI